MAQAISSSTRSSFIAQLLAPIAAPVDRAAGRKFLRDLKRELEDAWEYALHRYYAADAHRTYCTHTRRAAQIERKREPLPETAAEHHAELAFITAVDRLMHVPAQRIGALRLKQKLREVNGGRERWEAAITADEARLL